jgi:hypothetical protein
MLRRILLLTFALASAFAGPAHAHEEAFFGWPSYHVFNPYHPYRDSAILLPTGHGPVPVHVRVYSVPMISPYYNVPPYIVLDP